VEEFRFENTASIAEVAFRGKTIAGMLGVADEHQVPQMM
jgi:hypothetical protein